MLLDTCTFLWLVVDQKKISKTAIKKIEDSAGLLFISAISFFEIGLKIKKNLIRLPEQEDHWFAKVLELHQIVEIPISGKIALKAVQLPPIHNDPADRIIVATAIIHNMPVLTPDKHIHSYQEVKYFW